ncbi:hypothetical protein AVEN_155214-1 [Araneus ventricosus]|uniref:Uncharacterized protein n=1 Tax=Araneus ventricosus TaxID=182803 RepID=A0A4Y2EL32_ARAVE|nr:hypothetical protein AVEN_155214-1 [Araneus ventricosus]
MPFFSHFFTLVNWIHPSHLPAQSLLPSHAKLQDLQLMSLVNEPLSSEKVLEVFHGRRKRGQTPHAKFPENQRGDQAFGTKQRSKMAKRRRVFFSTRRMNQPQ